MSDYSLSLYSPWGVATREVPDWQQLSITRTVNAVGALTINLPYSDALWNLLRPWTILDVWRDKTRLMDTVWFCLAPEKSLAEDGTLSITASFADLMTLLNQRIVAYDTSLSITLIEHIRTMRRIIKIILPQK